MMVFKNLDELDAIDICSECGQKILTFRGAKTKPNSCKDHSEELIINEALIVDGTETPTEYMED